MLARELIDRIERQGLLDAEVLEALRQQLDEIGGHITPESVAKLLVDNGHLTRFQATKLIGELRAGQYEDDALAAESGAGDEELSLAEEFDEPAAAEAGSGQSGAAKAAVVFDDDDADAIDAEPVLGEAVDAEPLDAEPVGTRVVDAQPLEAEPIGGAPLAEAIPVAGTAAASRRPARPKPEKNQWDSFKIYGVLVILLIVLVLGYYLFQSLTRGSASEYLARGDEMYASQNYEAAIGAYEYYLNNFSGDEAKESFARVRVVLAQLFDANRKFRQPADVTKLANELLPKIETEQGLDASNRADLAGLLVDVAEKIARQADQAENADAKEQLVEDLDRQLELIESPKYLTSSLRQTLQNRVNGVTEDRQRVVRDIQRDRELAAAIAEIERLLKQQQTKEAYQVRRTLVRRYPQLLDNPRLAELVREASEVQKDLVDNGGVEPPVNTDEIENDVLRTVVLANRTGEATPELAGQVVYSRSRGSVIALDAEDGHLLWRRYVGYRDDYPPIALGPMADDGVLLSDGERSEVQKLDGRDGSVQWRAEIGEPFAEPVVQDGYVFVATQSGRLAMLSGETGRSEWVSDIPQQLEVGPLLTERQNLVYQTGDHSNLYLLDSRSGACVESYYTGHAEGAIRVPPVFLLNHLFVFDNSGEDYSLVHVLKTNDQGRGLERAQSDFRLVGNVVEPPQILDRRVIILTDRGQVLVLDIEPTKEGNQVSQVAELVASDQAPIHSQMEVDRGEMWVASDRLQRFELQINTGRVVGDWVQFEGDTFTAAPQLVNNVLLTTRVVRGTQGVRVAALDPKSGATHWQIDVGVPTALASVNPETNSVYAVTSQAALYLLDREAVATGATTGPIENPGGSGRAMRFGTPIPLSDGNAALVNHATPGQIAVFAPERERQKLRLVTLAIPPGSGPQRPVATGGGLLVPLTTGRIMLMDYRTGRSMAAPFQPAVEPGAEVQWSHPVVLPDDPDQVIIADNRGRIYRLRAGDQVRPLADKELPRKILGPAAAFADAVVLLAEGEVGDALLIVEAQGLEVRKEILLERKVAWGPFAVQDDVLFATDDGIVTRLNNVGETVWQVTLPEAVELTASPVEINGHLLLLGESGVLVTVDTASGEVQAQSTIDQPIASEPVLFGSRLLVPGDEGTIYVANPPEAPSPAR